MNRRVTIIDYGMGNLYSVARAFEHIGARVVVASSPGDVERAEHLVLPGVGAFGDGMRELSRRGLVDPINRYVEAGRPFLGICLGMQMMFEGSEEFGEHKGLGLLPGRVVPIPAETSSGGRRKVPHVGWNELVIPDTCPAWEGSILGGVPAGTAVYFVHSYTAVPADPVNRLADCHYEGFRVAAVVAGGTAYGCQFHPEKSGTAGITILRNFLKLPTGVGA